VSPAFDIVHVGYPKTGSTWFQKCFYPHVVSHRYLGQRRDIDRELVNPHAFAFDPARACARLGIEGGEPVIVCEENLVGDYETGGHMGALSKENAWRIASTFPRATIIIFIRHQVHIIASAYLEYLRQGGNYSVERFLFPGRYRRGAWRRPVKKPLFAFEYFRYVDLIEHYRHIFGPERVKVFAFEAFSENPRAFIEDYAQQLGLVADFEAIEYGTVNAAFRHRTIALARFLYLFTYWGVADKFCLLPSRHYRMLRRLIKCFDSSRLAGRKLSLRAVLRPQTVAFIEEYYASSNRALAAQTGLPLAAYGYPGIRPEPQTLTSGAPGMTAHSGLINPEHPA
jgi:hypothetical protein